MAAPQITAGSEVTAAKSLSVSQSESFLCEVKKTAMKTNGAIAGDSATGRNKFTARQWAALIGYFGVETWKQVQKLEANWKVHDATVVRTIVVTAIKEKQVDVDRQSSQVWFGDDVAKYI